MTLFVVLAVLLPWSLYRQMQPHAITRESLAKLPLIFGGVGVLAQVGNHLDTGHAALAALAVSVAASVLFGVWRGVRMPVWRGGGGTWMSQGNYVTMALWGGLIAFKFVLGAVGSQTGWYPVESVGEIFMTLGLSFAVQNVVVARRSISQPVAVDARGSLA